VLVDDDEVGKLEWPLERLWALRDDRLRALIAHASRHSRWHAKRLEGVDPVRLDGSSLERLPVMDKRDLMAHWDEIATDPRLTLEQASAGVEGYEFVTTGGSSGTPTVVAWDLDGWSAMAAVVMRAGMWFARGAQPPERFVQATLGSRSETSMSRRLGMFLANPIVQNHEIPARLSLSEIVEQLNEIQPDGVFGYASAIAAVAGEAIAGRLAIAPMLIGTSSEPLLPSMARLIREGFGVDPSDTLAATEIGALAARTFPGAAGLRLAEDIAIYEIDEDGMLLVTNVVNRALPLIRYRIGDRVQIDPPPGDIPWTGRVITILPPAEAEPVADELARLPEIVDYVVTKNGDRIEIEVWAPRDPLDRSQLRSLETKVGRGVSVTAVDSVQTLARTPAGKRKRFIGF
jgi:phenylacetate-coenzyme A ligase PaaK-like adenylate-forming protein